jgi:hypothetical protein
MAGRGHFFEAVEELQDRGGDDRTFCESKF